MTAAPGRLRRSVAICNIRGLHARAAARFVKVADSFDAEITVSRNGTEVPGVSIMGLMMLAAGLGSTIEIGAEGPQAEAALEALAGLVARRFDEEE
ncbi:MAG: HPr family phosphocarrier protein [Thalassobaculales bacterium]